MMTDFYIGLAMGVCVAILIGASLSVLIVMLSGRKLMDDIEDWSEKAYEPRRDQPRAITRVKSSDIEWEIN